MPKATLQAIGRLIASTQSGRTSQAWWLTIALISGAHIHFIVVDGRLPQDMGLYFQDLPQLHRAWWGKAPRAEIFDVLITSGGWLQVLISGVLAVVGRSGAAFRVFDLIATVSCVGLAGAVAWRAAGRQAGLIATLLCAITPMIVVTGRSSWIHIPELALLLGAVLAWVRDPELARWRTVAGLVIFGGLCLTLRPSALIWVGTLLPLLLIRIREAPKQVVATLVGWALVLPIALNDFSQYLEAKGFARERYARSVPELSHELSAELGPILLLVGLIGVSCAVSRKSGKLGLLSLAWIGLGVFLYGHFRAGLNNFSPLAAGLCILAAIGLGHRLGIWGVRLALAAFLFAYTLQWLPPPGPDEPAKGRLLALTRPSAPGNFAIPYTGFDASLVVGLIRASCTDPAQPCTVVADQGLFQPFTEDPSGQLERFLARVDKVSVLALSRPDMQHPSQAPSGVARIACGERDRKWRERHPHSKSNLNRMVWAHDLRVAWSRHFGADCRYFWLMPSGTNLAPEIAPEGKYHDTTLERRRSAAPDEVHKMDPDAP
jgi:hypothetical protein